MLECKAMNIPMETNLNLLVDTSLELVNDTLDRQIIGSLMYLTNIRPMLFCEHLESVSGRAQTCSPSRRKACDEIP
jgi:hypothetical protein